MNRKRDDFEYMDYEGHGIDPMVKKIKTPLPAVDKLTLKNNDGGSILLGEKHSAYANSIDKVGQNGLGTLAIISNLPPQVLEITFQLNRNSSFLSDYYKF